MSDAPFSSADAGFSLLELLVALAIAALVAMVIGGLFVVTATLRGRVAETARIEAALVDLQGLTQVMSSDLGLHLERASPAGFDLAPATADAAATTVGFRLIGAAASSVAQLTRKTLVAAASLSTFEDVGLEYLVSKPAGGADWERQPDSTVAPVGARLLLKLHDRVWRPLLWIESSSVVESDAGAQQ